MKKIKVGEKEVFEIHTINKHIEESKKVLDNSIPVIKDLIGRFDTEILLDIITGGDNTRRELESSMLKDIDKLSSIIMKDEFKGKLKYALSSFDETAKIMYKSAHNISDIIPVLNWCIEDYTARIKDYDKIIDEITSVYISNEKGIELYKKLEDIAKELNNINEIAEDYKILAVAIPPIYKGFINIDSQGTYNVNGLLTANVVKEVYK